MMVIFGARKCKRTDLMILGVELAKYWGGERASKYMQLFYLSALIHVRQHVYLVKLWFHYWLMSNGDDCKNWWYVL